MASIKKNYIYNICINISSVIFPLITAPYLARVLEPDGVGLMNFATTYANYYAMFALLGFYTYGAREFAKRRDSQVDKQNYFSEIITILLINTVVVSAIYLLTLFTVPRFNSNFLIFFIAGFALYLSPLQIGNVYLGGHERFGIWAARDLVIRTLWVLSILLFVKTKSDLYINVLLGVLANIGSIIWNFTAIKKDHIKIRLSLKNLKVHYRPMLILFASSVAVSIYTMLDSLMLGLMRDYSEVGYYNSSVNVAKTALMVVTSLSAVAIPRVSYYMEKKDIGAINDLLSKSFSVVAFLSIPMTIGLICIAGSFVPLFLGNAFLPAVLPLMIVSGVIIAIGFNNITGYQAMLAMGLDKPYLYCLLVGTFVNFTLNMLLIPAYGAAGASVSSVLAEFMILGAMLYAIHRLTPLHFNGIGKDVLKAAVASVAFIPATYCMSRMLTGWPFVIADIIVCVALYAIFQRFLKSQGYNLLLNTVNPLLRRTPRE